MKDTIMYRGVEYHRSNWTLIAALLFTFYGFLVGFVVSALVF